VEGIPPSIRMKISALLIWLLAISASAQGKPPGPDAADAELISDALKAGPAYITEHASIVAWPKTPGDVYRTLRQGTNGWTCLPSFPGTPHDEPMWCLDAVFLKFFQDAVTKRPVQIDRVGVCYMYAGGWVPNAPHTPAKVSDYHAGPHIMIVVPKGAGLEGYTTDPTTGGIYLNRIRGIDMPYLVIPIHEWPKP
jgi:hypothetical protein